MEKETKRWLRELAYYSSLGFSVALSIFIGLAVGIYLDRRFETAPWCTLIFLLIGIIAGFRNIAMVIRKTRNFK
jgi:ATP synthase protein I